MKYVACLECCFIENMDFEFDIYWIEGEKIYVLLSE